MEIFQEIDDWLSVHHPNRLTLGPERKYVTSFESLGKYAKERLVHDEQYIHLGKCLLSIVKSVKIHFPENIYWDFDYLVASLVRGALKSPKGFDQDISLKTEKIIHIFAIFGKFSLIKFRYIHDFFYGYDWLKWILEKKQLNDNPEPFGNDFLDYISNRGLEMKNLIETNDRDYPELNGLYRNPFLFSRSDENEINLHTNLSLAGNIPIEAWNPEAIPKSDQNYSIIRLEKSRVLGIERNFMSGHHKI